MFLYREHIKNIAILGTKVESIPYVRKDEKLAVHQVANGGLFKDIEHFKDCYGVYEGTKDRPTHVAVCVLTDGRCYVGYAICRKPEDRDEWKSYPKGLKVTSDWITGINHIAGDVYSHSLGYRYAVGRAIKAAVIDYTSPHTRNRLYGDMFMVDPEFEGATLRETCREHLGLII